MSVRAHFFRRSAGRSRLAPLASLPLLPLASVLLLAVVLASQSACSRKIGDSCQSNVECSPLGDRFCDLSSPNGYCTVEGCDAKSCPDGAACISFFSLQRGGSSSLCKPGRITRAGCTGPDCCEPGTPNCCRIGERCLCDDKDCTRAYCASETTERRWCMQPCDEQSDCDTSYSCYSTNQGGTVAVAMPDNSGAQPVLQYCAPNAVPTE